MRTAALVVLVFVLSGCVTHIPVRTQIDINAPVERVYDTLIDFANYPNWNPYHVRVDGVPQVGQALEITVRRPDGKVIDVPAVHIIRLKNNDEIVWGGGIKNVFYGEHVFKLQPLTRARTRLIHNEDFNGVFIGFADLPPDVLTQGYRDMNVALKHYIEKRGEDVYSLRKSTTPRKPDLFNK